MTRRLLQAMAGAPQGGAEIFFVRLAAALQRAGEAQRVLIRRHGERAGQLRKAGVIVAEAGFRGPFDLMTKAAFRREIAEWRPTLVLTWMNRATQLCPPGDFVHVARLGGYYDLKYYRGCDHLVGNTRAIAAYAIGHGWANDRVHYLPNFVPDLAGAESVARAEAGMPADVPLALALGRLHPNKGFDLLLDAIAKTRDVHLWLAGDGPLRAALEQQAVELGIGERIRFLGWRDDVARLLASVDLLVSSSRHEPLGNVVIEAWSAGVPVIATATDGPAALIEPGRTGLVVPIEAYALAEAMDALAHDGDRRVRLAAAGRAAYEAEFTEAAVVTAYRRFFDRIAA